MATVRMNEVEFEIVPSPKAGGGRDGHLSHLLSLQAVIDRLGFDPNVDDDPVKVRWSWGFYVNGVHCGIWDYKGFRWSYSGPREVFVALFGPEFVGEGAAAPKPNFFGGGK